MNNRRCPACRGTNFEKGRAFDGRRAYLCNSCYKIWTEGMQGRTKKYSIQRNGYQFKNKRMW